MSFAATSPNTSNEKPVLLIVSRNHGFFSLVFQAVGQAHVAEKMGATPVVYFNQQCLYWSEAGYQGARNVWEYYFEPLSTITAESLFTNEGAQLEGLSLDDFKAKCAGTRITVTNRYPPVVEYKSPLGVCRVRGFVNSLLNKYLILKPHVRQKVDDFYRTHFQNRHVVGVHYRGIEKTGDPLFARKAADPKECYFREMRRYMGKNLSAKMFIATDSAQFVDEAKAAFGDAVVTLEATRLAKEEEKVGLHFREPSKVNGPRMGEEVLLDALILAKTDFFIHGISNVSNAVLFLNPTLKHLDIEIKYGKKSVFLLREFQRRIRQVAPPVADRMESLEHYVRSQRLARARARGLSLL